MGGGLKDRACVNIWAEPGNFPPKRFIGEHSAVALVLTWLLCPRAAGQLRHAFMRHLYGFQLVSLDYAASMQFAR